MEQKRVSLIQVLTEEQTTGNTRLINEHLSPLMHQIVLIMTIKTNNVNKNDRNSQRGRPLPSSSPLHLWRLPVGGAAAPASSLTLMEAVDFGSFIVVCIGCYTFISFVYMLEGRSFITFIMFGFRSGLRLEGKYRRQPEGLAIA